MNFDNYEQVYLIGDVHGSWGPLWKEISENKKRIYIQVGDFGVGFRHKAVEDDQLKALNKILVETESILLVVRGNHDDPAYFNGKADLEKIKFLPDYTSLKIQGKHFLFIGGGISIDRKYRAVGHSYWCDEAVKRGELPKEKVDILVTHSAPDFCTPVGINDLVLNFAERDAHLLKELEAERALLAELFREIRPSRHYYGHFHFSSSEIIDDCEHVLLAEYEFKPLA